MATFMMFGKYTAEGMKGMSAERTGQAVDLMKKYDGTVLSVYALLGEKDLVLIVDFPGVEQAMQASAALSRMTAVAFATCPAVAVEQFDKLMREL